MNEIYKDEFKKLAIDNVRNLDELKEICINGKVDKLYKYRNGTPQDTENLENDELRMSCPSEYNDPFDSITAVISEEQLRNVWLKDAKEEVDILSNEFLTKCMMNIHNEMYPGYEKFVKSIQACCFSEEKDSILMWSHYAKDHTGFCIEYDMVKCQLPQIM